MLTPSVRPTGFARPWLPLVLMSAAACGCSSTQARPDWMQRLTWWETVDTDPRFAGPPPSKRIEQLRALAKQTSSMKPEEQRTLATDLATAYRNESDPMIRAETLRTIAGCACPIAGETLQEGLRDGEEFVRIVCCDAWARHGGPAAVPALSEALRKDAAHDVRLAALRALAKIPGLESVAAVSPALEDPDPAMQYRAVQALRELTGKDFGDDANAWRDYAKGGPPKAISPAQRIKLDTR